MVPRCFRCRHGGWAAFTRRYRYVHTEVAHPQSDPRDARTVPGRGVLRLRPAPPFPHPRGTPRPPPPEVSRRRRGSRQRPPAVLRRHLRNRPDHHPQERPRAPGDPHGAHRNNSAGQGKPLEGAAGRPQDRDGRREHPRPPGAGRHRELVLRHGRVAGKRRSPAGLRTAEGEGALRGPLFGRAARHRLRAGRSHGGQRSDIDGCHRRARRVRTLRPAVVPGALQRRRRRFLRGGRPGELRHRRAAVGLAGGLFARLRRRRPAVAGARGTPLRGIRADAAFFAGRSRCELHPESRLLPAPATAAAPRRNRIGRVVSERHIGHREGDGQRRRQPADLRRYLRGPRDGSVSSGAGDCCTARSGTPTERRPERPARRSGSVPPVAGEPRNDPDDVPARRPGGCRFPHRPRKTGARSSG